MHSHCQHIGPYVEFTAIIEQQVPNVALNDELLVLSQSCTYVSKRTRYDNPLPAVRVLGRFNYPNAIFLFALLKYFLKLL